LGVFPRTKEFQTRLPGHPVAKGAYIVPCDLDASHVEELEVRCGLRGGLFDDLHSVRALYLVAIRLADDGTRSDDGSFVALQLYVVAAGFAMILHPVMDRRPAHKIEQVLLEIKQNHIADHVAVVIARNKLLSAARFKPLEAVDSQVGEQPQRV